jgi:hypothetical protein
MGSLKRNASTPRVGISLGRRAAVEEADIPSFSRALIGSSRRKRHKRS